MSLDYYSAIFHIVVALLIIGSISIAHRIFVIKASIKHFCKYNLRSAFPEAAPIPQDGPIPRTTLIDFTWESSLWFKNYDDRAEIITVAALNAFNSNDFFLKDKLILDISIKAVKKSCFGSGFILTNYVTPRWGGEIFITFVNKLVDKPKDKPIVIIPPLKEIPKIRQIMVCKNV